MALHSEYTLHWICVFLVEIICAYDQLFKGPVHEMTCRRRSSSTTSLSGKNTNYRNIFTSLMNLSNKSGLQ